MSTRTKPTATKSRSLFGPAVPAAPRAGSEAGIALKEESIAHLHSRRWKDAIRVSLAAQTLRSNDVDLHAVIAIAGAHANKNGISEQAVEALGFIIRDTNRPDQDRASGLLAVSAVRLAQGRYNEADTEARKALAFDSEHEASWWHLTASFAGLGWFEQAGECVDLAQAKASTPFDGEAPDISTPASMPFDEWQVGKAINAWAMARTHMLVVTLFGFYLFGLLGLAVASSTPFVMRELRVMRLDRRWKDMAERAWQTEHRVRITHALITLTLLALWVLSLAYTRDITPTR